MSEMMMDDINSSDLKNIMLECGHFNLAIALFDTIVDDYSIHKDHIFHAFDQNNLIQSVPNIWNKVKKSLEPELNLVLTIICDFIRKLVDRYENNELMICELNLMLKQMYLSEMQKSNSLANSKMLPIYFIGRFATDLEKSRSFDLIIYQIAEIVAYWDDWLDLKSDINHGQQNIFLSKQKWKRSFQELAIGNFLLHRVIYIKISSSSDELFLLLRDEPAHRKNKILNFLDYLICNRHTVPSLPCESFAR